MNKRLYAPISAFGRKGGTPVTEQRAASLIRQYARALRRIRDQRKFARYQNAMANLMNQLDARKLEQVKARAVAGLVEADVPELVAEAEVEAADMQSEWQFGLEYSSVGSKGERNVDVNVDIRRTDGKKMSRQEAVDAFRAFRDTRRMPDGYKLHAIQWKRPDAWEAYRTKKGIAAYDATKDLRYLFANTSDAQWGDVEWRVGGIE